MSKNKANKQFNDFNTKFFRTFEVVKDGIDVEARTARLSFSSELPVRRSFGWEILSHRDGDADLTMLNNAAPFLDGHNPEAYLGDVIEASVADGRGSALVKLSRSAAGEQLLMDWSDGIHTKTSVGYMITDAKETEKRDGVPVYKMKWKALEISSVSIPADDTVGLGRSDEQNQEIKETKMDEQIKEQTPAPDLKVIRESAIRDEQKRVSDIMDLGNHHGEQGLAVEFTRSGKSFEEFKGQLLNAIAEKQRAAVKTVPSTIDMSNKEQKRYSFLRAINAAVSGDWNSAGLELEASRAVEKKFGRAAKGFFVPMDMMYAKRDVDWYTEKADTVQTTMLASSFIEMLYKRMLVKSLGCQVLDGIVGNIDIPRMSGGATVYWADNGGSENTPVTESTPTFDRISLTPKSMGAIVDVSKLLLNQSSLSVENLLLNDMTRQIAIALDAAALSGTGASGQPTGLLVAGITSSNVASAAAVDFGDMVDMESAVAVENADMGALAYVTNSLVRGILKQTPKIGSTFPSFIWEDGPNGEGRVNGYRAAVSNTIGEIANTSSMIFGNFADLILCMFAPGLDIMVDPYTSAKSRLVSLICYQDIDIGIRHLKSFAKAVNITT